ncbi:hypothetical protein ACHAXS_003626 [Conticribra weissflogii]
MNFDLSPSPSFARSSKKLSAVKTGKQEEYAKKRAENKMLELESGHISQINLQISPMNIPFPLGCPVWVDVTNQLLHHDNKGKNAQSQAEPRTYIEEKVISVWIDLINQNSTGSYVYEVKVSSHLFSDPKLFLPATDLAFPPECPVSIANESRSGCESGRVISFMPSPCVYTVKIPRIREKFQIVHGISADRVRYCDTSHSANNIQRSTTSHQNDVDSPAEKNDLNAETISSKNFPEEPPNDTKKDLILPASSKKHVRNWRCKSATVAVIQVVAHYVVKFVSQIGYSNTSNVL